MAYEIHWLRRASNELDAIYQFYSEFAGEQVAKRRIGRIIHSVDLLQNMPYLGRKDEDFTHIREYRYMVVLTYKVLPSNSILIFRLLCDLAAASRASWVVYCL